MALLVLVCIAGVVFDGITLFRSAQRAASAARSVVERFIQAAPAAPRGSPLPATPP